MLYIGSLIAIAFGMALIWLPPTSLATDPAVFGSALAFVAGGFTALGIAVATPQGLSKDPTIPVLLAAAGAVVFGLLLIWFAPQSIAGQPGTFGSAFAFIAAGFAAVGVTLAKARVGAMSDRDKKITYVFGLAAVFLGAIFIWMPSPYSGQAVAVAAAFTLASGGLATMGVAVKAP